MGGQCRRQGLVQGQLSALEPPYEAACWAVISHRIRIVQASAIKARITQRFGIPIAFPVEAPHAELIAFPAPAALLAADLDVVGGLTPTKVTWLRGIAQAALDGRLDPARLRSTPPESALHQLQQIPGIGPFSAELILLRGAGHPDTFPTHEPRLHRAMAALYDVGEDPDAARLASVADRWRPYRTWVAVLLRSSLEDQTREIATGVSSPARPPQGAYPGAGRATTAGATGRPRSTR